MTTGESTAGESLAETAKTTWKIDALWAWRHDVDTKIRHVLDKAMAAMGVRGPDPDAPIDVPSGITIDKETLHELLRNSRFQREHPPNGNGSVNGARQSWLRDAAIVVTLGLSAWTLKTVIDQGKDITRMQCQLSPSTCLQVTSRGP